ncbi:acetyl-CoA carboxylase biotin carboxyl carrier protein [Peribacillus alkalitolerans]|uniref:acetyl-CoA carboxylase biotin carboxyl carrier protein n=1 Tax=Peribacillus alkalitolerans TaxID=1550385 RepID=UPI0013D55111|nr:acetyl-CoA carboxylase biotin carboxyl carrier protein [Peribacillus alkalitolerans]
MLKVQEIRELIKLVDHSNIDEFEFETEGTKIKMKKTGAEQVGVMVASQPVVEKQVAVQTPVVQQAPSVESTVVNEVPIKEENQAINENLHKIVSPMVGTFYQSPSPDTDAYVKVGSKVNKDTVVCIVEAMKLFNEIESEVSGEIVEVLVKDGQLVEYGQPLFLVKA